MKQTNKAKVWVIFFDGKNTIITNKEEDYKDLKGVAVPIGAEVAANALALILERNKTI